MNFRTTGVCGSVAVALLYSLIALHVAAIGSAVLGIDLGTEYIKAVLVKPGAPLEIVLTKDSRRRELAVLGFKPASSDAPKLGSFPERLYGSDAAALAVRFPGETYPNLKSLLGLRSLEDSDLKKWRQRYPAVQFTTGDGEESVRLQSQAFSDTEGKFSVEELLAMQIQSIQRNAQDMAGKTYGVTDTAITIPPYYTLREKEAVRRATELAGLRLVAFVGDGLAVGINYASTRTFDNISEGKQAQFHLVYDVGAGSTSATLLRFQTRTIRDQYRRKKTIQEVSVIGYGWDTSLSGDRLNDLIVDKLVRDFIAKPEIIKLNLENSEQALRSNGRAMAKLWKEAEKARQVLSANSMAHISIESFHEDIDFRTKVDRKDFEKAASVLQSNVVQPIRDALQTQKMSLGDIDSVILHGGVSRTPFIRKELDKAVGADKVKTNVNADEAAAFGAAIKAASTMRGFRSARESRYYDLAVHPIVGTWSTGGKERQRYIFTAGASTGSEVNLPLSRLDDFSIELQQEVHSSSQTTLGSVPFLSVESANLTAVVAKLALDGPCAATQISGSYAVRLSSETGYAEVINATVSCTVRASVDEKVGGMVENVKDFLGLGKKKANEQESPLNSDTSDDPPNPSPEQGPKASGGLSKESSASPIPPSQPTVSNSSAMEGATESAGSKSHENKTLVYSFGYRVSLVDQIGSPPEQLVLVKSRLHNFTLAESRRLAREEARNVLEGYLYRAQDLLSDQGYVAYTSATERASIEKLLTELGEWIYADGAGAGRKAINDKLAAIKGLAEPGKTRLVEGEARPSAISRLKDSVQRMSSVVGLVRGEMEVLERAKAVASKAATESTSSTGTASAVEEIETPHDYDDLYEDDEEDESDESSSTLTSDAGNPSSAKPSKSSKTTKAKTKPTTSATPAPAFSASDLASYQKSYEDVESWLKARESEQAKLTNTEEPVLKVSDLEKRSKELEAVMMSIVNKMMAGKEGFGGTFGGSGGGPFGNGFDQDDLKDKIRDKVKKGKGKKEAKPKKHIIDEL